MSFAMPQPNVSMRSGAKTTQGESPDAADDVLAINGGAVDVGAAERKRDSPCLVNNW
jgi:hypothetical protein